MWLCAGSFLMYRGEHMLPGFDHFLVRFLVALLTGLGMFFFIFLKISFKHIKRIKAIEILKPCLFSFFDLKGYFMMALMISLGVILRTTHVISPLILGYFYMTMAIPLILSAIRFFLAWRNYNSLA